MYVAVRALAIEDSDIMQEDETHDVVERLNRSKQARLKVAWA